MIETIDLTSKFEQELNALLPNDGLLRFKIWANVGKHTPPERNGNKVTHFIEGNVKTVASAMEANKVLSIGVNSFTIEFLIPLHIPRTHVGQELAELSMIENGQYVFPAFIIGVISEYFKKSKAWKIACNENGTVTTYAVGIMGGVALPGDVDIHNYVGDSLPVKVNITANIVEGGTVSTDIVVSINGETLPAQVVTPSRTAVLNNDVLSTELESKSLATSSAFALQVQLPTSTHAGTKEIAEFLLKGKINRAYFIDIEWGEVEKDTKLMLIAKANGASQGVSIAGLTAELTEIVSHPELIAIPTGYQVGYFEFDDSADKTLRVIPTGDSYYFAGDTVGKFTAHNAVEFSIDDSNLVYNEQDDKYRFYVITSAPQIWANFIYLTPVSLKLYIDGDEITEADDYFYQAAPSSTYTIEVHAIIGGRAYDVSHLATYDGYLLDVGTENSIEVDGIIQMDDYARITANFGGKSAYVKLYTNE